MFSQEEKDLSLYRLSKAESYLKDAKKTLELEMYDTAANRSYQEKQKIRCICHGDHADPSDFVFYFSSSCSWFIRKVTSVPV